MNFHWYFIEISTRFSMDFHWYLIEIAIEIAIEILTEFPMDFHYWHFIENYIEY